MTRLCKFHINRWRKPVPVNRRDISNREAKSQRDPFIKFRRREDIQQKEVYKKEVMVQGCNYTKGFSGTLTLSGRFDVPKKYKYEDQKVFKLLTNW